MTVWTSELQPSSARWVGARSASRRVPFWSRWLLIAGALTCLVFGVARTVATSAHSSSRAAGAALTTHRPTASAAGWARLQSLPAQARSVISTSLGAATGAFAAERSAGGYRLSGGGLSARLARRGVTLRSGDASLSFTSLTINHGERRERIGLTSVAARGNRVIYAGGGISESYAAGPLGIEQSFSFRQRPVGAGGELVVALGLGGSVHAKRSGSELEFLTRSGRVALRYGGLVASDAHGRRLPATLTARGGELLLRVADAGAAYPLRIDPLIQTGSKIVPADATAGPNGSWFGSSVALSSDGSTALIGGDQDNNVGAAWVYTNSGGSWHEQAKLTGSLETGHGLFGASVALSSDGNTALIGGPFDNGNEGAAWVATRTGSTWSATTKLLAPVSPAMYGEVGDGQFGTSVALSADGTTALIGGEEDDSDVGAAWVFTGSGASLAVADKLVDAGTDASADFGSSVALSAPGTTALVGAFEDGSTVGAAWIFTGSAGSWAQQTELMGDGDNNGLFGWSVALNAGGTTALVGEPGGNSVGAGAAWVFTGSGASWPRQAELTAPASGTDAEIGAGNFGSAVALSANGSMALIGGSADATCGADCAAGAAWVFNAAGSSWDENAKLIAPTSGADAELGGGYFGTSVALSSDGTTSVIGGEADDTCGDLCYAGAAWASVPSDGFTFSPGSIAFGSSADGVDVDVSTAEQLTLTNGGYTPRVLGTVGLSGAQASSFTLSADGCSGRTLAPAASCAVTVNFDPAAVGVFDAQVEVPDNAPNSPDVVSVAGFAGLPPIPPPVLRASADVAPVGGTVLLRVPHGSAFLPLSSAENVPMGSTIDATNGTVEITVALPDGATQTGDFYDGEFVVTQAADGRVTATLTGGSFKGCPTPRKSSKHRKAVIRLAGAKKTATTVVRKLWGSAHGTFTTSARSGSASVLGTIWLTEDRCDGSYFKVTKDTIAVTAFAHPKKRHNLKQGQSILIP
jgi:hypothetical protein